MQISDITNQRIRLSSIEEKNKAKNKLAKLYSGASQKSIDDSLEIRSNPSSEITQLQEIEHKFLRNTASLQGLKKLQIGIQDWENKGIQENDWEKISADLKNIVKQTKYKGENVISYLSTPVNDSKSLYALKMNVNSEIRSLSSTLQEERKQLASQLVKLENKDSIQGFSAQQLAARISNILTSDNSDKVFKQFSNVNHLLGIGS